MENLDSINPIHYLKEWKVRPFKVNYQWVKQLNYQWVKQLNNYYLL